MSAVVTQEPELADDLSILENILLSVAPKSIFRHQNNVMWTQHVQKAQMKLGIDLPLTDLASTLDFIDRQYVTMLRAMISGKPIVLLDEPLSGLTDIEAKPILYAIKKMASSGVAALIVSHRQELIRGFADRAYQLKDGQMTNLCTTLPDVKTLPVETEISCGRPVLKIFSRPDVSKKSITIHEGELVGISCPRMGVLGSKLLSENKIQSAISDGLVSYVTSDRVREGLFCDLNIADNLCIRVMKQWIPTIFSFANNSRYRIAYSLATMIGLSTNVMNRSPLTLSGGNQQRVLLARALSTHPRLIFFDNATRGLDSIGKKVLVEQMKNYCLKGGSCIVVISVPLLIVPVAPTSPQGSS